MTQPEIWIAYIRVGSEALSAVEFQKAIVQGLIPAGAPVTFVVDVGGSGTAVRPGLQRLLELVRAGGVAGVACVDVSRLTRSSTILRTLIAELAHHGVALHTVSGPLRSARDILPFLELTDHLRNLSAEELRPLRRRPRS